MIAALFSVLGRVFSACPLRAAAFMSILVLGLLFVQALLITPVEASGRGSFQPAYYRQLEDYALEIERQGREKALEDALVEYRIRPGDNLSDIAKKYDVSLEELLCWNDLNNPHLIHPGQKINLLKVDGALHTVQEGDSVPEIAERYNVASHVIEEFNVLESKYDLEAGEQLVIPGGEVPEAERRAASNLLLASRSSWSSHSASASGGAAEVTPALLQKAPGFTWPITGRITSQFGPRSGSFHYGIDIAAAYGSLIQAAAPGLVEFTGNLRGYGLTLILDHGSGWSTLYAHNSKLLVQRGQHVEKGEPVARAGSSGNASGPHLHFEIIFDGQKYNPLPFLER